MQKSNATKTYFKKVESLYPDQVLDKVIVCIGTGGARSALENFARSGFRNYILMDADIVSETNIATQGVFITKWARKKLKLSVIEFWILILMPMLCAWIVFLMTIC